MATSTATRAFGAVSTSSPSLRKQRIKPLNARRAVQVGQTRRQLRVHAYQVTFIAEDGTKKVGQAGKDQYILEVADDLGVEIPCVCRSGTCASCAVRLVEGEVDYSDMFITTPSLDSLLSEEEIEYGLVPSCRSKPTTDVVVEWTEAGLH